MDGRALETIVFGMAAWGAQLAFGDPDDDELDAELLVRWMHTRLDTSGFPAGGRRSACAAPTTRGRTGW
jgi:hypothetical protein